jgi:NADPH-dependent curcumin reductase CurA
MASYIDGFQLDAPMTGGAIGKIIESNSPYYAVGDLVSHMLGWREEAIIHLSTPEAYGLMKLPALDVPPQTFLHMLGLTGGTAYFGLLKVADARPGDNVFVSAAAGAVGSAVVQIAKAKGMRVIGSAGGAEKCAQVMQLGAEACIDYKAGPVLQQLQKAAPDGIDVYFDNVGGEHLDAALMVARNFARFAVCGMISGYNDVGSEGERFRAMIRIIAARIRIQGFIYTDFMGEMQSFMTEMVPWVKSGQVTMKETVHEGIESAFDAFLGLFSGQNQGKMLVRL